MKLYELTAQHKELQSLADDGDLGTAIADTMEALEGEFEDKALSLIRVVKNMDSDSEALDAEIKRLHARQKTIANTQESMREYLRMNMEASGITKIDCPLFTITLAKGRDVLQITDPDIIPTDYLNIKTSVTPMKKEILDALKKGEDVNGCRVVTSKSSLRIK